MSAATAERVSVIPEVKQRFWATGAIVLIDVLALELALFLACLVRIGFGAFFPITLGVPQYAGLAIGVLILPFAYFCAGLYPGYGAGDVQRLRIRTYATLFVFGVLLSWNYIFEDRQWSRGVMLLTLIFALFIPPAFEVLLRRSLIARGVCGEPVVILGAGKTGAVLAKTLRQHFDLGFVPLGILDDDPQKWGTTIHDIPVVGPLSFVRSYEGRAKVVLIAIPAMERARLSALVQSLSFPSVIIIPDLFGIQSLWITSRDLGGVLGLEVRKNLLIPSNRFLKRLLDWLIALPLFLLSAPFMAACAAWINIQSRGSAFFRQEREGQNGKRITVYKLRTMHPNAERLLARHFEMHPELSASWSQYYKLKTDPRVLPGIGWFLRRYSLDELPQLWNVLRGDMSLVGPRPFPYYHLDSFPASFRALRTSVMPGLTGLWQVSERSDGDLRVQEVQDTYYIRNWSLWLDIYILLRTVQSLFVPAGAY
ncbi:MAG: exopolysaccharide biosynthesis polyprenyl glycosylphosphotransferase [Acidobacteriaceae bacterium]|nr:exopolysaccharide biosynthesis polyprenyl glycosylphosphotransferase [Acidobacteriaceae bacterium]